MPLTKSKAEEKRHCLYCGSVFFRKDYPKGFHRMITCGSRPCRKEHQKQWTMKKKCPDCGKSITYLSRRCKKCSTAGSNNPFYGKTHDDEAKSKIKLFRKGHIPFMKGRRHTVESRIKNSIAHQFSEIKPLNAGKNFRNAVRHSMKYAEWRQSVFIRDRFTCQNKQCGKKGGMLEAHHTISFGKLVKEAMSNLPLMTPYDACMIYEPLWDTDIGQTLCVKCHRRKDGKFICV